jgi:cell division protein FtsN
MVRDNNTRSTSRRSGNSRLGVGILAGTIIGLLIAVGVAWYQVKSPKAFMKTEQANPSKVQPQQPGSVTPPSNGNSSSAPSGAKPRFEFYDVLTKKQNAAIAPTTNPSDKARQAESVKNVDTKATHTFESQMLQAGSFSSALDAENLKAKLALLGFEANVQAATIPDKGVRYRVRLGPYKTQEAMNKASSYLKQNGVDSTPVRE